MNINPAKSYSSRELIRIIEADGWKLSGVEGDHYQFKHSVKPGKVTIPHPRKDISKRIARIIFKQAGLL